MDHTRSKWLAGVALVIGVVALALPLHAQEKKPAVRKPIGYGGPRVELQPFLVPVRAVDGTSRFEVLTVRLVLDVGEKQRQGCFTAPMVHEKFLIYLYKANLTPEDFMGKRRDLLMKGLLEVAIKSTMKGYYSAVEAVDENSPPLSDDPISLSLTQQCK